MVCVVAHVLLQYDLSRGLDMLRSDSLNPHSFVFGSTIQHIMEKQKVGHHDECHHSDLMFIDCTAY